MSEKLHLCYLSCFTHSFLDLYESCIPRRTDSGLLSVPLRIAIYSDQLSLWTLFLFLLEAVSRNIYHLSFLGYRQSHSQNGTFTQALSPKLSPLCLHISTRDDRPHHNRHATRFRRQERLRLNPMRKRRDPLRRPNNRTHHSKSPRSFSSYGIIHYPYPRGS